MIIEIKKTILSKLRVEIFHAGSKEIGGILFGEHIGEDKFRIVSATVQRKGGTSSSFIRDDKLAIKAINKLNDDFNHDYKRFNYFGEWHTHPNMCVLPSSKDKATVFEILNHKKNKLNFLVLMILKLDFSDKRVCISAKAFLKSNHIIDCSIIILD